jgi:hypothetical protein
MAQQRLVLLNTVLFSALLYLREMMQFCCLDVPMLRPLVRCFIVASLVTFPSSSFMRTSNAASVAPPPASFTCRARKLNRATFLAAPPVNNRKLLHSLSLNKQIAIVLTSSFSLSEAELPDSFSYISVDSVQVYHTLSGNGNQKPEPTVVCWPTLLQIQDTLSLLVMFIN